VSGVAVLFTEDIVAAVREQVADGLERAIGNVRHNAR
jgi:hypothetical protein